MEKTLVTDMKINLFKTFINKLISLNIFLSDIYLKFMGKICTLPDNFGLEKVAKDYRKTVEKEIQKIKSNQQEEKEIYILEIGAGCTSSFSQELKDKYSLNITGLDICETSLKKNILIDNLVVYDATNPNYEEDLKSFKDSFDLAVSKSFLEHIKNPEITHKLINFCLKEEGKAIHFYPTLYEFAFVINKIIPASLSRFIIKTSYSLENFPAYYEKCTAINNKLIDFFKSCGFLFEYEKNYFSTNYFKVIFPFYLIYLPVSLLTCFFRLKKFAAYSITCFEKIKIMDNK